MNATTVRTGIIARRMDGCGAYKKRLAFSIVTVIFRQSSAGRPHRNQYAQTINRQSTDTHNVHRDYRMCPNHTYSVALAKSQYNWFFSMPQIGNIACDPCVLHANYVGGNGILQTFRSNNNKQSTQHLTNFKHIHVFFIYLKKKTRTHTIQCTKGYS